ncbi:hypothetical protein KFL_000600010 [Klebsormidium nitens]|uniref:Uncharacterized protein n=1 Tax=Klebsormidium nitens TaxID=105231 RepID=A0A1Y1HPX5_KLENI|nr:hypothetical protein KFL_000600010 [Klebsormidium nitens]|eukprot:GAQ80684.1 hypothetical protein KFL_000600010 [Klebsormidium nitens]
MDADETFEKQDDELICFILDKLFPLESDLLECHASQGVQGLASFARASGRCARFVRERAWEAACRRIAPEVCAQIVQLGGEKSSPRDAGWMSFAKLLTWCPGGQESPEGMEGHPGDSGEQLSSAGMQAWLQELGSTGEKDDSRSKVSTMGAGRLINRIIYRGFIASDELWKSARGVYAPGACHFCAGPRRGLPVDEPVDTAVDFRVCSSGHVVGVVERAREGRHRAPFGRWGYSFSESEAEENGSEWSSDEDYSDLPLVATGE